MKYCDRMKLGDLAQVKGGKRLPKGVNLQSERNTHPYIRVRDLNGNKMLSLNSDYQYVDDETQMSISRYIVDNGDIILSIVGTIGLVGIVDETLEKANLTENCVKLIELKGIDRDYLYYFLKSEFGQNEIRKGTVGAVQAKLPIKNIQNIEIPVPNIGTQKKISKILSVIDEKIELNNKLNANLEDQMQILFNSILDMELKAGNKANIGDYLYVKGRIGWKGLKKNEYLEHSEYRIINGESLTNKGIDWDKAGYISKERYDESPEIMLQVGDILISKDGTIGKIGYVNKLDKPTSVASGIFVVRNIKPKEISTIFIYLLLKSTYFKRFIASRTEGSVIPHLYQKDFVTLEIPILTGDNLKLFNEDIVPLFEMYFLNNMQNINLVKLRDELLTKLMSGELDVSNSEA